MNELAEQKRQDTSLPQRRGYLPSARVWLVALILCGLVVVVRSTKVLGDNAQENLLTLILGFFACATMGCWLIFFSAYRRTTRGLVALTGLAAVCLFFAKYRIDHVNGELIPTFRARNAPAADELLEVTSGTGASANLSETGPEDFPRFLGPNGNGRLSESSFDRDWQLHPPTEVWRQPIGAGWSSFSAVNGFAVTMEQRGEEELITCYNVASGELVWSHGSKARYSTILGGTGPRCTPTIADGRVYAIGAMGQVTCLDGNNGDLIWQDNLLTRYGISEQDDLLNLGWGRSASPLVVDDLVVLPAGGSADGTRRSLIAYRKESGEVVWESGNRQIGFCSPIVATIAGARQVVTINEESASGHLVADGKLLWEHSWPGKNTASPNISQPIVLANDRILLSKGYRGGAVLLQLTATETDIGVTEIWRNPRVMKTKFTNAVVHDGHVYGLSDGILECVRLEDGRRAWKRGRYYHGQILGIDDMLLIQSEKGDIVLVEASPREWHEISRFSAISGTTACNPCLHGEYLLVRNSSEAACYKLQQKKAMKSTL